MKSLLIVHHSVTGGTLQMAQAAAAGARRETEVNVRLVLRPKQIGARDLARCEELGATLAAGLALGIF